MHKLIVGNWKMYPTYTDSIVLSGTLKKGLERIHGVEVVLAPPVGWLAPVLEHWKHPLTHVQFAAQNIWPEDQGAYTGEMSAYMLKDLVKYAIIGHSERRRYASEDDDLINQKVLSALRWRLRPIICIGELKKGGKGGALDERECQRLETQVTAALRGVKKEYFDQVAIAYEPVWAIGTGDQADADYTVAVISHLRSTLRAGYGKAVDDLRFLYGGSVDAENAGSYLRHAEIGGLLVGGASVKSGVFLTICELAAKS